MKRSRQILFLVLGIAAVALAVFGIVQIVNLRPPSELTIATGREEGAYYAFALQYQEKMAALGYTLHILPTAGSLDAIQAVANGEADVAFAEAGAHAVAGVDTSELYTLASLFYEPMWVFYRADLTPAPETLAEFEGLRVSIGEEGSGTRAAAIALLADNGVDESNTTFFALPPKETLEGLRSGEVDVAFAVASPASPFAQEVLTDPQIEIMSMNRFLAYQGRYKNITVLTLGEGAVDLADNVPDEDKKLLATVATLVAGPTLHPDLARLLLGISAEVHHDGGLFEGTAEFPSDKLVTLPLSKDARNFLENGPTGLERYVPFWVASRVERILFLLLPLLVLFYPFFRSTPLALTFYFRYRIFRWYQFVRNIEQGIATYSEAEIDAKIKDLQGLQQELTASMRVPVMYLADFYNLRLHINLVINRLNARRAQMTGEPAPKPEELLQWTEMPHANLEPNQDVVE